MSVLTKFILIFLGAVIGNGLGAWNIRTIASTRYKATIILTFSAAMVQGTAVRAIARDQWIYVLAWALGSVIGIIGAMWIDDKLFTKKWLRKK